MGRPALPTSPDLRVQKLRDKAKAYYHAHRDERRAYEKGRQADKQEKFRAWVKANPEKARARWSASIKRYRLTESGRRALDNQDLKKRYGLTGSDFEQMNVAQNGLCFICHQAPSGKRKRRLEVDHDHQTGAIRKLLCHGCNAGMGNFKDRPELLLRAAAYLAAHMEPEASQGIYI